ncbi:hypothetical protein [Flammeovirga sp. SJP92]|uniref:hypothetical protein n=1 Tax=Flammeovirga sp. SJP92 TaxID=1775430 RepID=UPI000786D8BD|nr:hypothetical protein [Flammeovirga sp. SJP92]KXX69876.1 hypothetical protein AVL50_13400 [Flammeovirga sp. SJP92]
MKSILLSIFTFGLGTTFFSLNQNGNKNRRLKVGFYRLEHDDLIFEMSVSPSGQIEERWKSKSPVKTQKKYVFKGVNQLQKTQTPAYCLDGEISVVENGQVSFSDDFIKLKVSKENQPVNTHGFPYTFVAQDPRWTI